MTATHTPAIDVPTAQAFLQKWTDAWNDHDGDAVAALCSEDLAYDEPAIEGTVHGRGPIRDFVGQLHSAFPDYRFAREGLYIEVDRPALLVAWTMTGTLAGTERTILLHGDDRLEFNADGLINAYRCVYDYTPIRRLFRSSTPTA